MGFHFKRNLVILFTLLAVVQFAKCQDEQPTESEEEDDSSSEETVEDSDEGGQRRRRRFADLVADSVPKSSGEVDAKPGRAIPGLPDPETILKIAEILISVGQEVLPQLVQGNSASNYVTDRVDRNVKFFKKLKNEVDILAQNLKRK